ncbi:hypothetical protein I317_04415 [Kwoniella heveanensis CBS 569]|nr:hypothetical protein I317_04415 [Kwoniella heveanensis CBS 569]
MVAEAPSTPRVAPIKLKLNFGSKLASASGTGTPYTPTPTLEDTFAYESPIALPRKGKGKEKAATVVDAAQDDSPSTPAKVGGKRKKDAKPTKISLSIPALPTSNGESAERQPSPIENRAQSEAGPSRPRSVTPLAQAALDDDEPKQEEEESAVISPAPQIASLPVTPAASDKAIAKSRGRPSSSKRTAKFTPKSRLNKAKARARPSAIPSHIQSEISTPSTPSTPSGLNHSTSLPETPGGEGSVRMESSENTSLDPLSLPMSPAGAEYDIGEAPSTPQGGGGDDLATPATGRGRRGGGRWMRVKRPLKELLNRIMTEIRKKDDYALFEEPVDLEAFPEYLDAIGGEGNMMDMGTMQSKVDNGEYTSIEQIEADLKTLVGSAQKFNPPGSIPYNSASRILAIGMKHVERSKPLVLTPSPSPTRNSATPFRGGSVVSGREKEDTIAPGYEEPATAIEALPPSLVIPEKMLDFPPNSLQALAVGWNLNGGRRLHAKRVVRSREKFGGKWRHWELDGTRDVAEMEDIENLLDQWRFKGREQLRQVVNWKALRKNGSWWESDASLASTSTIAGNPPTPYAAYSPRRDKIIERELGANEWGLNADIDAEMAFIRKRTGMRDADGSEVLAEHIRPMRPRHPERELPSPPNLINIYDDNVNLKTAKRPVGDWVREMCTGDTLGEAYLTSVDRFIRGAMASASPPSLSQQDSPDRKGEDEKADSAHDAMPLDEYVFKEYQDGVLSSGARHVAFTTFEALNSTCPPRPSATPSVLFSKGSTSQAMQYEPSWAVESARQAYARYAMKKLTSADNPMDIKPLLRMENDFLHQGVGGKSGVQEGLNWIGNEIERMDKEVRAELRADEEDADGDKNEAGSSSQGTTTSGHSAEVKRKREDDGMEVEIEQGDYKKAKMEASASDPQITAPPSSCSDSASRSSGRLTNVPPNTIETNGTTIPSTDANKPSTVPADTPELRRLRLELVALSKFYPLPALKKMTKEEADKLLPFNVRALMTVPSAVPVPPFGPPGVEPPKGKEKDKGRDGEGKKRK